MPVKEAWFTTPRVCPTCSKVLMPWIHKMRLHGACKFRNGVTTTSRIRVKGFSLHPRQKFRVMCDSPAEGIKHLQSVMKLTTRLIEEKNEELKKLDTVIKIGDELKKIEHLTDLKKTLGNKRRRKKLSRTTGRVVEEVVHGEFVTPVVHPGSFTTCNVTNEVRIEDPGENGNQTVRNSSSCCKLKGLQLFETEDATEKKTPATIAKGNGLYYVKVNDINDLVAGESDKIGRKIESYSMQNIKELQIALEEKEEVVRSKKEEIQKIVERKKIIEEKEKDCMEEMREVQEIIHYWNTVK